jgi:ABC-type sugar transport system permease subunit
MNITQRTKHRLSFAATVLLLLAPAMISLILFQYYPMVIAIWNSFRNFTLLAPQNSHFNGFTNYLRLYHDVKFWHSILTTLVFAAAKVVIQVPLALALAFLIQQKIRGSVIVRSAIFAPVVTAVSIAAVIWNMMYHPDQGLINAILQTVGIARQPFLTSVGEALPSIIVMSVWQDVGFTMLLFLAGLQGIPQDYYEAASIDGANRFKMFRHITLPLLMRTTLYAVVTTTIFSFRAFTQVYIMTSGGPSDATRLAVYHIYETGFVFSEMGYASAMAVVLITILMIIAFVQGRLLSANFEY